MTGTLLTVPAEYETNTDEYDALALDVTPELDVGESVASAACELRRLDTHVDVSAAGFPATATVASNVVTQRFDARALSAGAHTWIWTITLNTSAIRSYRTVLRVESHD